MPGGPWSVVVSVNSEPLKLDAENAWLEGVRRVPSPNFDERPPGSQPELVVVHSISLPEGEFGTPHVEALFCNRLDASAHGSFAEIAPLRVSAHALIARDGALTQFVPFTKRAWHAGESCFRGRACCNDFSIGIELEGCDWQPFEAHQYARLADLLRLLMRAWPGIDADRVVGHCDIAPGRKTDPGPHFDWRRLRRLV